MHESGPYGQFYAKLRVREPKVASLGFTQRRIQATGIKRVPSGLCLSGRQVRVWPRAKGRKERMTFGHLLLTTFPVWMCPKLTRVTSQPLHLSLTYRTHFGCSWAAHSVLGVVAICSHVTSCGTVCHNAYNSGLESRGDTTHEHQRAKLRIRCVQVFHP